MRKLLDYAAQYQIRSGIHRPTDISPVGMAAALNLDLVIHNFGIQEYMPHGALTNEVFRQSLTFEDFPVTVLRVGRRYLVPTTALLALLAVE
jgi:mannonate dehydratase